MAAELIDGKAIAQSVRAEVARDVAAWVEAGHPAPGLATVLVFAVTRVILIPQGEFVTYGALSFAMLSVGKVPGTAWLAVAMGIVAFGLDLFAARLGKAGELGVIDGAGAKLRDRHHRRMPEGAVGFAGEPRQFRLRDGVADERPDHLDRHFGVGLAGKAGDGFRRKARPVLRHIEAAVASETRERDIHEAKRRGLAAGGDVAHE